MKVIASHNSNPSVRRLSSAGGVFSILAEQTLARGGAVYGAALDDNFRVVHRRVDKSDDLAALRGSKYAFSHIGSSVADAMADLEAGREVLFSGTPCQIAAMARRAGDNPLLLLVEVVCHGAPKPEYWDRYLTELCDSLGRRRSDITAINFRDKVTGWKDYSLTVTFSDGFTFAQRHVDNPYLYAFIKNYTLREACFKCPFKHPASKADIAIGDLWGIANFAPEIDNNLGTSSVIILTGKGDEAAQALCIDKELDFATIARSNKALTSLATKGPHFEDFNRMAPTHFIKACRKYASRPLKERLIQKFFNIIASLKSK